MRRSRVGGESHEALGSTTFVRSLINGDIANDERYVFFATRSSGACGPGEDSVIGRVSLANSTLVEYDRGCLLPSQPVSDGTSLFLLEWQQEDLLRIDLATGTIVVLADTARAVAHRGLRTSATHVYWADDLGLRRIPKAGGAIETIVTGQNDDISLLGVDAQDAYITRSNSSTGYNPALHRVGFDGGTLVSLAGTEERPFAYFAMEATDLYWWRWGAGIRRLSKFGGAPIMIASPPRMPSV